MTMQGGSFGKYDLIREIGRGAMGIVYLAHDSVLERQVAVKTIAAGSSKEEYRQRFIREARSAAKLSHPSIITIHDFGEQDGQLYIVMEYLDGVDLDQLIALNHPIDVKDRIRIVLDICRGILFAHQSGVIHRDLKPSNIKLMPNGQVKILDFGLSIMQDSSLTQSRMIMGTPNYIAPERIKGEACDARSDQFALGLILYEFLTGEPAFQGDTIPGLLYQIINTQPFRLGGELVQAFPAINRIISRAISKDPSQRFQTVQDMCTALDQLLSDLSQAGISDTSRLPLSDIRYGEGRSDPELFQPGGPFTQPLVRPDNPVRRKTTFLIVLSFLFITGLSLLLLRHDPSDIQSHETPQEIKTESLGQLQLDALPFLTVNKVISLPDGNPVEMMGLIGAVTPLSVHLPAGEYNLECLSGYDQTPVRLNVRIEPGQSCIRFWTHEEPRHSQMTQTLLTELTAE